MAQDILIVLAIIIVMILLIAIRDHECWMALYLNHCMQHFRTQVSRDSRLFTAQELHQIFVEQLGVLEFFLEPHPAVGFSNRELSWLLNAGVHLGSTASLVFGYVNKTSDPLVWMEFSRYQKLWLLHYEHGRPKFTAYDPSRFCAVRRITAPRAQPGCHATFLKCPNPD